MKLVYEYHRFADAIIKNDLYLGERYNEFINVLEGISDEDLIEDFKKKKVEHKDRGTSFKSLTSSINCLIKERMELLPNWDKEVPIFNVPEEVLGKTKWRLDFGCEEGFAVEIAFNHGEAIAWNLIKPVLASELNHVEKAYQTKIGIYVCATEAMKKAGNIDSASGSFEKVRRYLLPMMNQLTVPMVIIGIDEPDTFRIDNITKEIIKF